MAVIVVAGASGFIGSHTIEVLRESGHQVIAVDRPGASFDIARRAGAEVVEVDLLDEDAAITALEGAELAVNATGLFHLGASEATLEKINVTLADRFVRAARAAGVRRVVHLSSVAVYGAPSRVPQGESGPLRPRIAYERTKLRGEQVALSHQGNGIEVAAIRPTLVYGPRSRYGQALVIAAMAQLRAFGVKRARLLRGGPRGHHVHAEDVARATELALFHDDAAGRAFNVADDAPIAHGDAMCAIGEAIGLDLSGSMRLPIAWPVAKYVVNRFSDPLLGRLNRQLERGWKSLERRGETIELKPTFDADWPAYGMGEYEFDTTRIKSLGFKPKYPRFADSIGDVVRWYYDAGWLPAPKGARPRRDNDDRPKTKSASSTGNATA